MPLQIQILPHLLQFKFDARTSRGAMRQHQVYYLKLSDGTPGGISGIGECAPLPGLSQEYKPDFGQVLATQVDRWNAWLKDKDIASFETMLYLEELASFPAIRFGLETAWLDYRHQGNKVLYPTPFTMGTQGIPINGLIWMGDKAFMQSQIREKLAAGYRCLKLKIGGLDFDTELSLLQAIRKVAGPADLTIRLDANGAFPANLALEKLRRLAAFHIHSIEQPIRQGQVPAMAHLVRHTPIPIALDEELIGIYSAEAKASLLSTIQPHYIILKPTLIGGLAPTADWIALAREKNIGWWITSALESNIGLNAISQFTATLPIAMEQGLGTGQLYHNNISSPLTIRRGQLYYEPSRKWGTELLQG